MLCHLGAKGGDQWSNCLKVPPWGWGFWCRWGFDVNAFVHVHTYTMAWCSACAKFWAWNSWLSWRKWCSCLRNRAREVAVFESDDNGDVVASLERAIREQFSDLPNLWPISQLIFQVCRMYFIWLSELILNSESQSHESILFIWCCKWRVRNGTCLLTWCPGTNWKSLL